MKIHQKIDLKISGRKFLAWTLLIICLTMIFLLYQTQAKVDAKSIGYQFSIRGDASVAIANASPQGYSSLNPQSLLWGRSLAQNLAFEITKDQKTELEKLQALVSWTKTHIRTQNSGPTTIFQDDYVNVMKRGWGYCDQIAHVFATLATYSGFEAAQLQLFRNDGVSPHTIATVKIDGQWRIVSPWRGVIPLKPDGSMYTISEFSDFIEETPSYQFSSADSELFRNAKVFKTYPYLDNVSVAQKIVNRIVLRAKSYLSGASGASGASVSDNELKLLDEARTSHLKLEYPKAESLYRSLESTLRNKALLDSTKYYLAMLLFDKKAFSEAGARFNNIYEDSSSAWKIAGGRMLAEVNLKLNRYEEALKILDDIDNVQSRVRAEEIRKLLKNS